MNKVIKPPVKQVFDSLTDTHISILSDILKSFTEITTHIHYEVALTHEQKEAVNQIRKSLAQIAYNISKLNMEQTDE